MKFQTFLLKIAFSCCLITSMEAQAYQCEAPFRDVKEELKGSSEVFVGKVTKILPKVSGDKIPVNFEITKSFKGKSTSIALVHLNTIDNDPYSCNPIYPGKEYLVYASVSGSKLVTEICTRGILGRKCSRTRSVESAKEDLHILSSSIHK